MKLEENHEVVGHLVDIKNDGRCIKLQFSIQKFFEIPLNAIPAEKMEAAIGSRIGILNSNGVYKLRKANKK